MSPGAVDVPNESLQVHKPQAPAQPAYYIESIGNRLKPEMRQIFETYGGIPSEKLEAHLYAARQAAWQLHPYPCLGMWSFLNPVLRHLHTYPFLLPIAKRPGARILDVGCGLGQDVRQLVFDGVPTRNLYATDTEAGLWRLGMGLWMDEARLGTGAGAGAPTGVQFMRGNVLNLEEKENEAGTGGPGCLAEWKGSFDVVYAGNVLHLFLGDEVLTAAKNMLALTKPGGWIVLHQIGGQGKWPPYTNANGYRNTTANRNGDATTNANVNRESGSGSGSGSDSAVGLPGYAHNGASWRQLWERVEADTGIRAEVQTWEGGFEEWQVPVEDIRWFPPGSCAFEMVARRCD